MRRQDKGKCKFIIHKIKSTTRTRTIIELNEDQIRMLGLPLVSPENQHREK